MPFGARCRSPEKGFAQTSFLRKLLAYRETWQQGLHKTHLDIPNFRVLTVTTNRERVAHLVEACRSLPGAGSRLFLFTDKESLSRGDILTHDWVNGKGEIEARRTSEARRVLEKTESCPHIYTRLWT